MRCPCCKGDKVEYNQFAMHYLCLNITCSASFNSVGDVMYLPKREEIEIIKEGFKE